MLLEEREIDAAVAAMLHESRVGGEVVLLAVLQHKQAIILEQIPTQDDIGKFWYLRQSIRRVGKNEIELLAALRYELEDIGTNGHGRRVLQLIDKLLDEAVVTYVKLYADNMATATADELERNASRPRKEVKGCRLLAEIKICL